MLKILRKSKTIISKFDQVAGSGNIKINVVSVYYEQNFF